MGKSEKGNSVFRDRLNQLANKFDSVTAFAAYIGLSRQTVGFWLNGDRVPDANSLVTISKKMSVSCDWLLGLTDTANASADANIRMVAEYTSLSDDAIKFLKTLSSSKDDYPVPIKWTDGWKDEEEEKIATTPYVFWMNEKNEVEDTLYTSSYADVELEAVYPSEILSIINWLLTHQSGLTMLVALYRLANIDYRGVNFANQIELPMKNSKRTLTIDLSMLIFSMKQMISMLIDTICKEIQNDGK